MKKYIHVELNENDALWKKFEAGFQKSGLKNKTDFVRLTLAKGLGK